MFSNNFSPFFSPYTSFLHFLVRLPSLLNENRFPNIWAQSHLLFTEHPSIGDLERLDFPNFPFCVRRNCFLFTSKYPRVPALSFRLHSTAFSFPFSLNTARLDVLDASS